MWTIKDDFSGLFKGITFLGCGGGIALTGYTIFQYAKQGEWIWVLMADVLPDHFVAWAHHPEDWVGIANFVSVVFVDRSMALILFLIGMVAGWLFFRIYEDAGF